METTKRRYKAISFKDRQVIEEMAKAGVKPPELAKIIGVHVATMRRELQKGETENGYSAIAAQCAVAR